MHQLPPSKVAILLDWLLPDRAGPLVGLHVLQTGNGACFVDRWPDPRALLVDAAGNYSLAGDPESLQSADLKPRIAGFVEAPQRFLPVLRAAFPGLLEHFARQHSKHTRGGEAGFLGSTSGCSLCDRRSDPRAGAATVKAAPSHVISA
jgi:hypothetical protein